MKASIVIPTYNRAGHLRKALDSIQRLNLPRTWLIEVLVVDNSSADDTAAVVEASRESGSLPVRHFVETNQGLNHCRNRGLLESSSDWLIYLDDDMLIDQDWFLGFAEAVGTLDPDAVVGPVEPWFEEPPADWLTPAMIRSVSSPYSRKGDKACIVEPGRSHELPGCNFAVRRSIALAVGGFHPSLDRAGKGMLAGGDFEFGIKVGRLGGRVVYSPRCRIRHHIGRKKLSAEALRSRFAGMGATSRALAMLDGREAKRHRKLLFWLSMIRDRVASQMLRLLGRRGQSLQRELEAHYISGWLYGAPPLEVRAWPPQQLEAPAPRAHESV